MTNEQSIEVAEKVWGYRYIEDGAGKDWVFEPQPYLIKVWDGGYDEIMMPELSEQINSWQGFGRTVEAMLAKGLPLNLTAPDKERPNFSQESVDRICKSMIAKTHLAALEAVRKEKK